VFASRFPGIAAMVNFRVDTLWPWLRIEPPNDTPGFRFVPDDPGPNGFGPMSLGYDPAREAATPVGGGNEFGLSNWRPPNTDPIAPYAAPPTAPRPEPQPWWSLPPLNNEGLRPDLKWPWLRFGPLDEPPGFRKALEGLVPGGVGLMAGAYDPRGQAVPPAGAGNEFGLSNWRPPNANPFAQHATSPPAPGAESELSWQWPQDNDQEIRPDLKWPWLRAEPAEEPPGFRVAPDGGIASVPTGNTNPFGLDWRPQGFGLATPFGAGPLAPFVGQPSEPSSQAQP
jgi:hypothetical protein